MASGDIKKAFGSSTNLTVTNLNSLATSSGHSAGWESATIDNSSNLYDDYELKAKITAGTTLTAGEIRMWIVVQLDDSTYPDVFDGTESTETVTDGEMRDAICHLAALTQTDTTNSDVYYLSCPSVKKICGGNMPSRFVVFITQSTNANLASSGNQVTYKGSYYTVAP